MKGLTKKNIVIILICVLTLVVSIVGLTIFFTRQDKTNQTVLPIVISVHDMTMTVGQTTENFMSISNPEAEVEYVYDENIVAINGNSIKALSAGSCEVKVQAEYHDSKASESFKVTVENNEMTYSVNIITGGNAEGNTLYLQDEICQFTISLYDENNVKIENPTCQFSPQDDESELYYEMNQFLLIANNDTKIIITYPKYNLNIELKVVVNK